MKHPALILVLLTAPLAALAQPIYRCGPDGKVYSQVPCADGTVMDASDPRTAAQRAEARKAAAQERKAAADLERERLARERAPSAPAASLSGPSPAAAAASAQGDGGKTRSKPKAESGPKKEFSAVAPKAPKTAPAR
jgi:hypothetical protein